MKIGTQTRFPTAGFTLLEVLVALTILSIGLLGLASMLTKGMRFNHQAYVRTQATYIAYDLIDRIRANRDAAGSYLIALEDFPADVATMPASVAKNDMQSFLAKLNDAIPGGDASIGANIVVTPNVYTLTMVWFDRDQAVNVTQSWDFVP